MATNTPSWAQSIAIIIIVFACVALLIWSGLDQTGIQPPPK